MKLTESYRLMRGAREVNYEYIFELPAEFLVGLDVCIRYNAKVSLRLYFMLLRYVAWTEYSRSVERRRLQPWHMVHRLFLL